MVANKCGLPINYKKFTYLPSLLVTNSCKQLHSYKNYEILQIGEKVIEEFRVTNSPA